MAKSHHSIKDAINTINTISAQEEEDVPFPALFTVHEAARVLKMTPNGMRRLLGCGAVPGFKLGGEWRLRRADVLALVHSVYVPASPGRRAASRKERIP